jgi:hypothetical protein
MAVLAEHAAAAVVPALLPFQPPIQLRLHGVHSWIFQEAISPALCRAARRGRSANSTAHISAARAPPGPATCSSLATGRRRLSALLPSMAPSLSQLRVVAVDPRTKPRLEPGTDDSLLAFDRRHRHRVERWKSKSSKLVQGIAKLTVLRSLSLANCCIFASKPGTRRSTRGLAGALHGMVCLRHLELRGGTLEGGALSQAMQAVQPGLASLSLEQNTIEEDLATALREGPMLLTSLVILDNMTYDGIANHMHWSLSSYRFLQQLSLGAELQTPDETQIMLASSLEALSHLQCLDLLHQGLAPSQAMALLQKLTTPERLTHLALRVSLATSNLQLQADATRQSSQIARLSTLRGLDLSGCLTGSQGAAALADVLASLPQLQELAVADGWFGEQGAAALVPALARLSHLTCLRLSACWCDEMQEAPADTAVEAERAAVRAVLRGGCNDRRAARPAAPCAPAS